ncbi:nucleoside-diphosphate sugar epimerase [Thalassospira profundimaris]|uniref:Nucleoside-diphosphate sugar epimerase n=1 Tax=Thalassospira profundimaris TaxID=502049 RepID=A0A367X9F3_9PROT|nr:SDR family oxidoreductase [Thalassospira profundimaris]RCK50278.1 nucleoside-diphosphate sugar epimerase [Thalassospira profundimaris]
MKKLITGASGHFGTLALDHALHRLTPNDLAVSTRSPEKADAIAAKGIEVRKGDFDDPALMEQAFTDIDTALIISAEADNETRIRQHRNAITAAKNAGVKHVIYTSVIDPRTDSAFTYSAIHADTEAFIHQSGLNYTILRNSFYADLLLGGVPHALETGQYAAPAGDAGITFISRNNLAEIAAIVLANPEQHVNKTYELTGTKAITHSEIAAIISKATGKDIHFADLPDDVYQGILRNIGLPEHGVIAISGLYVGAKNGDYDKVSPDAAMLLGHQPQTVEDFLTDALAQE